MQHFIEEYTFVLLIRATRSNRSRDTIPFFLAVGLLAYFHRSLSCCLSLESVKRRLEHALLQPNGRLGETSTRRPPSGRLSHTSARPLRSLLSSSIYWSAPVDILYIIEDEYTSITVLLCSCMKWVAVPITSSRKRLDYKFCTLIWSYLRGPRSLSVA